MSTTRYIYKYQTNQPALCQIDAYTYAIGGHTPKHWIDKAYGYGCADHQACFWIDDKFIYPINPDGTAAGDEPIYYYGD